VWLRCGRRRSRLALGGQRDHGDRHAGNRAHRGFRLRAHAFPGAGFRRVDIDRKNTLPSVTVIADSTLALVKATPRGDATLARASITCCCVTLTRASPESFRF